MNAWRRSSVTARATEVLYASQAQNSSQLTVFTFSVKAHFWVILFILLELHSRYRHQHSNLTRQFTA